jgi:hypothetical protein
MRGRPRADCPGWESNPHTPGFKPGRSADWRTWAFASIRLNEGHPRGWECLDPQAEAVGLEPTSGHRRHPFSRRAPDPAGWLPSIDLRHLHHLQFRGLESNQRPPRSERGVTTTSNCPGFTAPHTPIREGGFEPPPPDSKSGSLPVSRFPSLNCHLSFVICIRPTTLRDRGFEPRLPGWKPGVVPLDQPRVTNRPSLHYQRKERELNPQGSSLARFRIGCRRRSACPSVLRVDGH